jgi:hypothetical protein
MLIPFDFRGKISYLFLNKYLSNRNHNVFVIYISVSVFIAIYRLIFMWRVSFAEFYADEKNWAEVARSSNFFENAITPDAGYFVPLTRSVFWLASRFSSTPEIAIHLFSCFIVGFCCSSLILFRGIKVQIYKKVVIALCLGLYQSFDLLLWMNLNYYIFIVCSFFLLNRMTMRIEVNNKISKTFAMLIMISLGKPQLSLSCCFLLLATLIVKGFRFRSISKWYFEIVLITSLFTSILFSRFNSSPLDLNIATENFLFAIAAILNVPFVVIAPILAIGNSKISETIDNSNFDLFFNILSMIFSIILYLQLYRNKPRNLNFLLFFFIGMFPLYFSLFIFPNTGWANNFFWNNNCISCMSSRHIFPVYFFALMIMQSYSKNRFTNLLLIQILGLNVIYLVTGQVF